MILTDQQKKEFEEAARPLIEWLNVPGNAHPHCHVVVGSGHAELSEGVVCFRTEEYIRD